MCLQMEAYYVAKVWPICMVCRERRRFSASAILVRQLSFQPVAIEAVAEVTKPLEHFGVEGRL